MHPYFGTVYPKSKKFKRIYNKNEEQKWIPNLFREHNIYLFQSIVGCTSVFSKKNVRNSIFLSKNGQKTVYGFFIREKMLKIVQKRDKI